MTALLFSAYRRLDRQGRARLAISEAAGSTLQMVASEVRQSVAVSATGNQLQLKRMPLPAPARLPEAYPSPPPALTPAFQPQDSSQFFLVTYRIESDGNLWRQVDAPGQPPQRQQLLTRPQAFQSTPQSDGTLAVALNVTLEDRVEELRVAVYRPMP